MAVRGWGGSVATAIGVAAGAGAAQLGLGYGLGIIAWMPSTAGRGDVAWVASLAWAAWIGATSTVAGAVCAQRLVRPNAPAQPTGGATVPPGAAPLLVASLRRLTVAIAAAFGGLVTVVLVAVPARGAIPGQAASPQTIAAGYAVIGVIVGLLVALWALASPAVARNVVATVGWLWLLAVAAVIDGVISGRGVAGAQLGVWQLTPNDDRFWFRDYFYWPGAALSLGSALVIGALTARAAARVPAARVGTAVSGVAGPLLVAVAYFLAAPQLVGIRAEQMSAHLMAPYAVVAGLAGSALVTALAQRAELVAALAPAADPAGTGRSDALATGGPDALGTGGSVGDATRTGGPDGDGLGKGAPLALPAGRPKRATNAVPAARRPAGTSADRPGKAPDGGPAGTPDEPAGDVADPGASAPGGPDASTASGSGANGGETSGGGAAPADGGAAPERPKGRVGRLGRRGR
ncbi:hypothetical protein AB0J86_02195 [Micromonospora sp. NPDC049559]|uniref:hypothetical protein n=1 Tax=Micromonospora sp. NPDC049559 TaxID=3155923 RepID=UPI003448E7DD